ncbi:FAD-dependent monooxygenase [Mucilaginibacter sp. CAU 1740]|uniref:FAD-dependent monooxygenase n=1 Tax=Mucilaginibacter sp. CAU 1740 TaxID=3140365 RepID=UPI00325AF846
MSQVKAARWFKGKTVLLGDAAHAPTPFTGMGTALSLIGAYILAGEISQNNNVQTAFEAYERVFKPFAEETQQQMSPRVMRLIHPTSKFGITVARLLTKLLASQPVQRLLRSRAGKDENSKEGKFTLPVYNSLSDGRGELKEL